MVTVTGTGCRGFGAWTKSRGVRLSYVSYETAVSDVEHLPPLLVLHGLFGSKSNWTSLAKAIHKTTGRKVITADARNHGDSPHSDRHTYRHMAADVEELMDRLGVPRASLLGHSMGGRTAMLLALLSPQRVSSLVVGDISPFRSSPNVYLVSELFRSLDAVSVPDGLPMSKARKLADAQLASAVPDVAVRNFIVTNLVQADDKRYRWRINVPVLKDNFRENIADFPEDLRGLRYEGGTLFVAGGNSDYVRRDELPQLRTLFPSAELTFVEGAGHWVHSEKPDAFLKLVCDFLIRF